jgi:phosphatidylserine/phosphatidylglycerophosphate/cardiolipin synthase-like enzyme
MMAETLQNSIRSGVNVIVVTRPAEDYAEKDRGRINNILNFLIDKGIEVVKKPQIYQKYAVIDGRINWYGSVNLLGYDSAEESIMRLESVGIAGELLKIK